MTDPFLVNSVKSLSDILAPSLQALDILRRNRELSAHATSRPRISRPSGSPGSPGNKTESVFSRLYPAEEIAHQQEVVSRRARSSRPRGGTMNTTTNSSSNQVNAPKASAVHSRLYDAALNSAATRQRWVDEQRRLREEQERHEFANECTFHPSRRRAVQDIRSGRRRTATSGPADDEEGRKPKRRTSARPVDHDALIKRLACLDVEHRRRLAAVAQDAAKQIELQDCTFEPNAHRIQSADAVADHRGHGTPPRGERSRSATGMSGVPFSLGAERRSPPRPTPELFDRLYSDASDRAERRRQHFDRAVQLEEVRCDFDVPHLYVLVGQQRGYGFPLANIGFIKTIFCHMHQIQLFLPPQLALRVSALSANYHLAAGYGQ